MADRCNLCEMIPICEIKTPEEYKQCIYAFGNMIGAGILESVYQTCPLEMIVDKQGRFYSERIFHQFRCTKCGTIYGMLVNTHLGGQIKIDKKAFNPDDYPSKEK